LLSVNYLAPRESLYQSAFPCGKHAVQSVRVRPRGNVIPTAGRNLLFFVTELLTNSRLLALLGMTTCGELNVTLRKLEVAGWWELMSFARVFRE